MSSIVFQYFLRSVISSLYCFSSVALLWLSAATSFSSCSASLAPLQALHLFAHVVERGRLPSASRSPSSRAALPSSISLLAFSIRVSLLFSASHFFCASSIAFLLALAAFSPDLSPLASLDAAASRRWPPSLGACGSSPRRRAPSSRARAPWFDSRRQRVRARAGRMRTRPSAAGRAAATGRARRLISSSSTRSASSSCSASSARRSASRSSPGVLGRRAGAGSRDSALARAASSSRSFCCNAATFGSTAGGLRRRRGCRGRGGRLTAPWLSPGPRSPPRRHVERLAQSDGAARAPGSGMCERRPRSRGVERRRASGSSPWLPS